MHYLDDMDQTDFVVVMSKAMMSVRGNAKAHGFDTDKREDGTLIALMHSELSECLEALRHGNPASEHIPEFNGAEEEFADLIIRVMDMCQDRNWRLPEAILAKMQFNESRPYQHGGKKF